ncbi:hypothetical protein SmJEL517_g05238 [Synchytrium microbalum]|uniref:Major facilitator superfamily (MFS) profile domain-containing protein n=1 Tax=Synchytrium microbalum TaxID=1806994 RepID=A0A507BQA9_9FUNG|nr:uncharacterized protein SmJEL517_g05238 [Synchytrium microbalum]TPX31437.1 hypothetical protein SmJEL517_g05238 [Synchytrium microbalum]
MEPMYIEDQTMPGKSPSTDERSAHTRTRTVTPVSTDAPLLGSHATLQALAIIIPQVQHEFDVPTALSGLGSTSSFLGMLIGAGSFGILADIIGRRTAFNATLFLTCVFAFGSGLAPSFAALCGLLASMGFGIGGNLPVDGTLFLEFMPTEQQKLLTLLSVFWPVGQVATSLSGWFLMPSRSCASALDCPRSSNEGWRYVLFVLGTMTGAMFVARFFVFRMLESPKFLLSRGKRQEALDVLNHLGRQGKIELDLTIEDMPQLRVRDDDASPSTGKIWRTSSSWMEVVSSNMSKFTPANIRPLFSKSMWLTTLLVNLIWYHIQQDVCRLWIYHVQWLLACALGVVSIAGVPASFAGMWLIETSLGRRGTMVLSAIGTVISFVLFNFSRSQASLLGFSCLSTFFSNMIYGVLFTYTPEVFASSYRATACGIASALGRITGALAPLMSGAFLSIWSDLPLYFAAGLIGVAGLCMALLPIETRGRPSL